MAVGGSITFGRVINNGILCDADANARYLAQCTRFFNGDVHPLTGKFADQLLRDVFRLLPKVGSGIALPSRSNTFPSVRD